jgi:hypothetical protein
VPGEQGSEWSTYQLQPPGGGQQWSAPADASTLRPAAAPVTHATLGEHPLEYDAQAHRWTTSLTLNHEDGSTQDTYLILTEDQAQHLADQIHRRDGGAS